MQRDAFAHAGDGLGQTIGFDRLDQVIDCVDLERVEGELAVGGDEHDRRRVLEMLQGLGELQTRGLGHVDVEEDDIDGIFLQFLDGLAHAGGLGDHVGLAELVEQEAQLRTRRRLIVDDHCFQHDGLLLDNLPHMHTVPYYRWRVKCNR